MSVTLPEVLTDPVLRRWAIGRVLKSWPAAEPAKAPGYAIADRADWELALGGPVGAALGDFGGTRAKLPLDLMLPAQRLIIDGRRNPFDGRGADETALVALYGFAWATQGTEFMSVLWPAWLENMGESRKGPAWKPKIVASRAVALLDFALSNGLPGPREETLAALVGHVRFLTDAVVNAKGDESFDTLARCGHALVRLGLDLGAVPVAEFGFSVLLGEAGHLVRPSGMTILESTYHHLGLTGVYADAWLAARRHGHVRAAALEAVLVRLLGAAHALTLPGGLPPIGDVLSLVPPDWLSGLLKGDSGESGWLAGIDADSRRALIALRDDVAPADLEALRADGWLRRDSGPWSGLWHCPPSGWSKRRGSGHHDLGAFELHYEGVPVFVDAGGCSVGAVNGAGICHRARAHGGLLLDDRPPYPTDHDVYSDAFRSAIGGPSPVLRAEFDGVSLSLQGFNRLGGPRELRRRWAFDNDRMEIHDAINGTGRFRVLRRFLTTLAVTRVEEGLILDGQDKRFLLRVDGPIDLKRGEMWRGFGRSRPVQTIECRMQANLPWRGRLTLEVC